MQIKPPGAFSRGKIILGGPAPHITPDSLLHELTQMWGPQGFKVYKSALVGLDVALKKSGWTGIAIKIKQNAGGTELAYNAFAPSTFVRFMAMGLIPILILNSTSWKPLLRTFEQYIQGSPFFGGQMQLHQGMPVHQPMPMQQGMPQMQQGMPQMQQQGMPQMQQGMQPAQHQAQAAQQQAQAAPQQAQVAQQQEQQYPCPQCQYVLQWVAEHQRWYCASCQQYV